jgi:hypothetical protein
MRAGMSGRLQDPKRAKRQKPSAGYSTTPLARKLGIREGSRVRLAGTPPGFAKLLEPLPPGVRFVTRMDETVDLAHFFLVKRAALVDALVATLPKLRHDAAIWISWPKKASGVRTDLVEDTIREVALPLGLVDVKVCAVDETWSGLKLVFRLENRNPRRSGATGGPGAEP